VTITYAEEVTVAALCYAGAQDETVLVYFLRVVRHVPYASRKCIFGDNVSFDKLRRSTIHTTLQSCRYQIIIIIVICTTNIVLHFD